MSENSYKLNEQYLDSWNRTKQTTTELADQIFLTKAPPGKASNSMKILKGGKEYWLTTLDVELLTLFALHMLMEECWKKNILLIGITKDTSARDFKRQLVPIMQNEGLLKATLEDKALAALPNTDRMVFNPPAFLMLKK